MKTDQNLSKLSCFQSLHRVPEHMQLALCITTPVGLITFYKVGGVFVTDHVFALVISSIWG